MHRAGIAKAVSGARKKSQVRLWSAITAHNEKGAQYEEDKKQPNVMLTITLLQADLF